jgi:hypothetical protein
MSSGPGFAAPFLVLPGFLAAVSVGAGADGVGKIGRAAGGKTVGSRVAQPGTLLRSTQPTTCITGPKNVLWTDLTGIGTRSTKRTTGCKPSAASGLDRHRFHALVTASRKILALVSSRTSPREGVHIQQPSAGLYSSSSGQGGGGLPTGVSRMS